MLKYNQGGIMEKTIIMSAVDDKLKLSVSPSMDATTAFQMLGTLTTHLLNAFTEAALHDVNATKGMTAKEKHAAITGIKESMYDAVDNILSNALNAYYPENPTLNLEEEAILKLTNELIEKRYNALSEKEKAAYARHQAKIKAMFEKQKKQSDKDESTRS